MCDQERCDQYVRQAVQVLPESFFAEADWVPSHDERDYAAPVEEPAP